MFSLTTSVLIVHSDKLTPFGEALTNQALRLYNSAAPCPTSDRCPERLFTTMVSDMRATCPRNDLAKRAAGSNEFFIAQFRIIKGIELYQHSEYFSICECQ